MDYLQIVVAFLVIVGWFATYYYTNKSNIKNQKREIINQYLIKAYQILACDITNRKATDERVRQLEDINADIQLFGTKKQIELMGKIRNDLENRAPAPNLTNLINELRNDLRTELDLDPISELYQCLRDTNNQN